MLTGTMLLMWIGENHQRGIGNGISLIIFASIVSGIPSAIGGTINLVNTGEQLPCCYWYFSCYSSNCWSNYLC